MDDNLCSGIKKCARCKRDLPVLCFAMRNGKLHSWCRECNGKVNKTVPSHLERAEKRVVKAREDFEQGVMCGGDHIIKR